jgi:hypothetical protein
LIAVTSFNPDTQKYGLRCIETLKKFFPGKIVAYVDTPLEFEGVEVRDFYSIPGVRSYLERIARHPGADGTGPNGYDYRYDASKFCRKVFAQEAVFDEDQYVYWFDADCIVLQAIPEGFLKELVIRPLAYLGRKGEQAYTETGWLGFNTKHEEFQAFRQKYLSYFTSGRIFSQLKGWHDCIAFDYARQGINGNNLTPNAHGVQQVVGDSKLAKYLVHLKGNRKFSDKRAKKALAGTH